MLLQDDPFFILDAMPTDSLKVINEKTEEKAFMDDKNEKCMKMLVCSRYATKIGFAML